MENSIIIFKSRPVVMQRLMDAVVNGYSHYCTGTVSVGRCAKLVNKYELNYHILADRNERARRKRAGLGNATLVLWLHNGTVRWWLMVTHPDAGDHAAHSIETLSDANTLKERIAIDDYELVRLPKKAVKKVASENLATAVPSKTKKNTRLTWRMNAHKYQAWRDSIIESVRNSSTRSLELLIYRLWSSPGFGGIRTQIGNISVLYRNEVKRAARKDAPTLPKNLSYVRRLSNSGITLTELTAQEKMLSAGNFTSTQFANIDVEQQDANSVLVSDSSCQTN